MLMYIEVRIKTHTTNCRDSPPTTRQGESCIAEGDSVHHENDFLTHKGQRR